ncbi:hypothetical protein DPQ25_00605 [Hydrogeniiclostridium mannosilyticum]|uniref:Large polyvalent protein-associated domain-containing protein n=1 Tax=Hydrogeniiclostridium mannosilyticum TaxID=2764322 RepID=A0A328UKH2_9FIRM|nr:LPD11 domain-containing protein [Hydrogeniiclostridium mannosilyticum]RAQ30043.1 hypothetical protein DPQ25_00605 [Hydrogeniiclostridium mannosilyticum]
MHTHADKKDKLELTFIGEDFWSCPVYKDQFGCLWKDINLGEGKPALYKSSNNDADGEPECPIDREFVIVVPQMKSDKSFQYMMLDRLRTDCDYYLTYGGRYAGVLAHKDERQQIEEMKKLWLAFSEEEKPEWLTWEQILAYEKQMCKDTEAINE